MIPYLVSEKIKIRHTFLNKLIWLAPLVPMLIALLISGGYFQITSYNWWYAAFLPGMLSLSCALLAEKDKKMNNRAILSLPVSLKRVWVSKVLLVLGILICTCIIFFCGIQLFSLLLNKGGFQIISVKNTLLGSFVLVVTFMWQIPICLFLGNKIGIFSTVLLNVIANGVGFAFATKSIWLINPYAYPSRLMIPIVKILPNGMFAEPGSATFTSELLSYSVILPGLVISVVLFLLFTYVTTKWFEKQEAK
ncbi:lantibiotic immunity ABC transporter MutE/EpiE family permease subunit [Bacillus pseudomycoides]|uniref:lantibiotic immunity ABC transporter MutE/EpiE family permease subunit n=1 Tax=Bacillus pseudomycoides TaxID=64104 RepID=UPI000BEFCA0C|nr:lantibiotic immunity ABC transporter MutE/EpiE family permease subunit [Bacillus pseudomycoides]PEJ29053.1 bacteriocin ABC transporter permease [Bacillus pseudomycoides]PFZ09589.1 bacteriocin ABC transporter permease [Bacillus pseudomycoides]PGA62447.1 bacteriocin ABC transporter permease [Bacillus pseudomycoides]PHE22804.1 bacteriocin ABC transporter permease [Bacillus pseudomycoides]PHE93026.1 bacteriocin ABC transporter permease [Bacillus pseudomycoides]